MIREEHVDIEAGFRARIVYHVAGDGPPVLLLHGWGASWRLWQDTMEALAAAGLRGYAPDHIGCGASSKPLLWYTPHDYAAYLDAFIAAVGLEHYVLIGHSMGGHLALWLAERRPQQVSRLVLVDPAFCAARQLVATRAELLLVVAAVPVLGELVLALMHPRLMTWLLRKPWGGVHRPDRVSPDFIRSLAEDYCRASPMVGNSVTYLFLWSLPVLSRLRRGADLLRQAGAAAMPALLMWGEQDALLNPASYAALAARLPRARTQTFADAGHTPPEEAPQQFQQTLLQFLKGTD